MLTIYKASAGSGKTFTLAYEYIKTLLGIKDPEGDRYYLNSAKYAPGGFRRSNRHSSILAITFTNAATDEMKTRIVRQLNSLADASTMADNPYTVMLIEDFGCTKEELREAAELALSELLYDYNSFNVSTIDSFFQMVLRTFAREIDHQGDYELSIDRKETIRHAISLMLDELNLSGERYAPGLYNWIKGYVLDRVGEGTGYNFFNREGSILNGLARDMEYAMDETYSRFADDIDAYLADPQKINAFRRVLADKINNIFVSVAALANDLNDYRTSRGLPDDFFGKSLQSRIDTLALKPRKLPSKLFDIKIFEKKPDDLTAEDIFTKKIYKSYDSQAEEAVPLVRDFIYNLKLAAAQKKIYSELLASLGNIEFIGYARRTLEDFLRESNMVLISDTGDLLKRIISDAEMPFIYERLGMRLTNLLIDEFQDTSRMQWDILKPLVSNSLAGGNDNLIIGDEKQAIYRFRNSDSELLGSEVQTKYFPSQHRLRGSLAKDNTNHRSAGDIVRFNNALFTHIAEKLGAKHYGNVAQAIPERLDKLPAYIKLRFSEGGNEADTLVLESMAQDILRQHEMGYTWNDIMILVRTGKEAKKIVEFLSSVHPEIKLLSSEALLLSRSSAVRAIISMLKLVSRSYEGKNATRGDDAPLYATKGDIIMMIIRFNHFSARGYDNLTALEKALEEGSEATEHLAARVNEIRAENPANLVALIEAIVAHRLTPEQRRDEYAYIAALQDLAIKHTESADPSLSAFLHEYDRNESRWAILTPSNLDAVQVMTVHKSKGLERPCVHLPFAGWELTHASNGIWIEMKNFTEFDASILPPALRVNVSAKSPLADSELSPVAQTILDDRDAETIDNLNAAYVAFTRASRELIVHPTQCGIGEYIAKAFDKIMKSQELPFRLEDEYYILGEPTAPKSYKTDESGQSNAGEYTVRFRNDVRDLVSIDDILAADTDIGDEDEKEIVDKPEPFAGTPEMHAAAERGQNLHAILASMRTLDDLDKAVDRHCSRLDLGENEAEDFRSELMRAFNVAGDMADAWFDPDNRVFPERSVYNPRTGRTSRPDRVIERPDGKMTVVDYKFTGEVRASHKKQVAEYKELVGALSDGDVEAFIWYPLLDKIIKV